METFYTEEVLPIKPVSNQERRQKMWIVKRKNFKKKIKKENKPKKPSKHIIDIYV